MEKLLHKQTHGRIYRFSATFAKNNKVFIIFDFKIHFINLDDSLTSSSINSCKFLFLPFSSVPLFLLPNMGISVSHATS